MNMWWTTKNMWRTTKNIQIYSKEFKWLLSCFNLKFSSWQYKQTVREGIIPSCKIHMVEEKTLGRGPKDGGKEELGEEEWVSLNTLSLRKTKIWQDYSTSLKLKRGEERGVFLCALEWRRWGVYIVVVERIWREGHLMRVDKESWT